MMSFGDRVRTLRKAIGIRSQHQLAAMVGVKQPTISYIESGTTNVGDLRVETFMRLVAALRTNPVYLYTGIGPVGPLINPNLEEAEAASLHRQLGDGFRDAWIACGYALLKAQPVAPKPSADSPFDADVKLPR